MLQTIEFGTPVDVERYVELNLQEVVYTGESFGLLGTQTISRTVSSAIRDACLSGDLAAVHSYLTTQRMPVQYMRVSWNETLVNGNYELTDFTIGVVCNVTYAFNTGPAYLIDSLRTFDWLKNMIDAMGTSFTWEAWRIAEQNPYGEPFYRVHIGMHSTEPWNAVVGMGQNYEHESLENLINYLITEGNIYSVMGQFVAKMLDEGYSSATLFGYDVKVALEFLGVFQVGTFFHYAYRTHVALVVDFNSVPSPEETPAGTASLSLGALLAVKLILGLAAIIGATIVGSIYFNNISQPVEEKIEKYDIITLTNPTDEEQTYTLPDGTQITIPPGGTYTYTGYESESKSEPSGGDWIGDAATIIAMGGAAALVLFAVIKAF